MIPEKVRVILNKLMKECIEDDTPSYLYMMDKVSFAYKLYYCNGIGISRWEALRISIVEPDLIDRDRLSQGVVDYIDSLIEQAKESV